MNMILSFLSSLVALKRKREREKTSRENMTLLAFNTFIPRIRIVTLIAQGKSQEKSKEIDE